MKITANSFRKYKAKSKAYRVYGDNLKISVNPTGLIRVDFLYKDDERKQHLTLLGKFKNPPPKELVKHMADEHARLKLAIHNGARDFWKVEMEKAEDRALVEAHKDALANPHEYPPLPPKYQAQADSERFRAVAKAYTDDFEARGKVSYVNERGLVAKLVDGVGSAKGLGNHRPSDIKEREIQAILDAIAPNQPTTAYALKKVCKRMWKWMRRRGHVETADAVFDLEAQTPPPRDRLITQDELKRYVTDIHPYAFAVVLNPLRLVEHTRVTWESLDEENNTTVRVKGGRNHVQPLTDLYLSCGRSKREDGGPLFLGRHNQGTILRTSLSDICKSQAVKSDIPNWHTHDLRSMFGSWHERNGTSFEVWDACLAHKKAGLRGTYGLYSYLKEKREAIQKWEDFVVSLNPTVLDPVEN